MRVQALSEQPNTAQEPSLASLKVLVVDDLPTNRRLAQCIFEALGCRVWTADDGFAAVVLANTTEFDLIVMDRNMPNCDGDRATRMIRAAACGSRGARILSYSSCPPTGPAAAIYDGVIPKPARLADFVEYVFPNVRRSPLRLAA